MHGTMIAHADGRFWQSSAADRLYPIAVIVTVFEHFKQLAPSTTQSQHSDVCLSSVLYAFLLYCSMPSGYLPFGSYDAYSNVETFKQTAHRPYIMAWFSTVFSNFTWCCRYFPGPYDAYTEAKAATALASSRQAAALEKQRKHIESSIQTAERQARQVRPRR